MRVFIGMYFEDVMMLVLFVIDDCNLSEQQCSTYSRELTPIPLNTHQYTIHHTHTHTHIICNLLFWL